MGTQKRSLKKCPFLNLKLVKLIKQGLENEKLFILLDKQALNNNDSHFTSGESFLLNGDLSSQEPLLIDNSSQDVLSVASSHGSGSTPPREFVVSAFEPNNCGAEFTVSSQNSYEEIRGKVSYLALSESNVIFQIIVCSAQHIICRSNTSCGIFQEPPN